MDFSGFTQGMLSWYSNTIGIGYCGILNGFQNFLQKYMTKMNAKYSGRKHTTLSFLRIPCRGLKKKCKGRKYRIISLQISSEKCSKT